MISGRSLDVGALGPRFFLFSCKLLRVISVLVCCLILSLTLCPKAHAEVYVAGQMGVTLPKDLTDVGGIQLARGVSLTDLHLKSSLEAGVKVGYFLPRSLNWLGAETEFFYTSPHLKQQDVTVSGMSTPDLASYLGSSPVAIPPGSTGNTGGAHMRVATWAFNLIARYPGERFEPYVGVGLGVFWARLSGNDNGPGTASDTRTGVNLLAGVRLHVSPAVSVFTEYKFNRATFDFGGGTDPLNKGIFFTANYLAHILTFGITYQFDTPSVDQIFVKGLRPVRVEKTTDAEAKAAPESLFPKEQPVLTSLPGTGDYTVIPLPAFAYNRNEGSWYGALMPVLKANRQGEVEDIFAPLYLHNHLVGDTFTLNYFGYRAETVQFHGVASYATKIERDFELSYKDLGAGGGRYILGADVNWFKNAFARFFGFGNRASELLETTYTSREFNAKLTAGLYLASGWAVLLTERYHDVRVEDGIVPSLPQTKLVFPDTPGIEGAQILGHGLTFLYDTRDTVLTPLKGTYVNLLGEFNQNFHTKGRNQWWRMTLDARRLVPHFSDRMVFVARLLVDGVIGQDENDILEDTIESQPGIFTTVRTVGRRGVPFYERPTLGGETTLRGFGRSRFISNTAILINLEERIRILRKTVFDNVVELEIAPFLDVGRVARSFTSEQFVKNVQVNPGVGIRLIARPNVVGRLDVGYGRDGAAVFVGLDYPF